MKNIRNVDLEGVFFKEETIEEQLKTFYSLMEKDFGLARLRFDRARELFEKEGTPHKFLSLVSPFDEDYVPVYGRFVEFYDFTGNHVYYDTNNIEEYEAFYKIKSDYEGICSRIQTFCEKFLYYRFEHKGFTLQYDENEIFVEDRIGKHTVLKFSEVNNENISKISREYWCYLLCFACDNYNFLCIAEKVKKYLDFTPEFVVLEK